MVQEMWFGKSGYHYQMSHAKICILLEIYLILLEMVNYSPSFNPPLTPGARKWCSLRKLLRVSGDSEREP